MRSGRPGEALELGDHAGRGERDALLAADLDALAELLDDAGLERHALRGADALADDEPGAGLEGRREAHRAQPGIARLQAPDRGVALAHVGEARAVDVEREDPLHLARRGARLGGARDLDHDRPVAAAHAGAGGPPFAVGHEGQVQMAHLSPALVHRRREALQEADRGVQRERPARLERELPRQSLPLPLHARASAETVRQPRVEPQRLQRPPTGRAPDP